MVGGSSELSCFPGSRIKKPQSKYLLFLLCLLSLLLSLVFKSVDHKISASMLYWIFQVMIYNKALHLSTWTMSGGQMDSGQVVNHISTDAQNIAVSMTFIHNSWAGPLKILIALIFLVNEVGVAALLGFFVLIILVPANYFLAAKMGQYQKKGLEIGDERLRNSNEMLQGMKLLKLYAWEGWFCDLLERIRDREMRVKVKTALLNALISFITTCTTTIVALVTFVSYVKIMGRDLTPSKAFASLALVNLMKVPLFVFPMLVRMVVNARVSTKRLIPYLTAPEIDKLREEAPVCKIEDVDDQNPEEFKMVSLKLTTNREELPRLPGSPTMDINVKFPEDTIDGQDSVSSPSASFVPDFCIPPHIAVIINNTSFSWDPNATEPTISNVNINIPKGKLSMIVGPVGSGKSSLVSALLGEMTTVDGQVIWADDVTVAYATQKPWLLNDTVKNNILFGQPYIHERYVAILEACAMKSDLEILPAGKGHFVFLFHVFKCIVSCWIQCLFIFCQVSVFLSCNIVKLMSNWTDVVGPKSD